MISEVAFALFAHFYLDEAVDIVLAELLRSREMRATTTRDAGNLDVSDVGQLEFATEGHMVLLTHNREDYQKPHARYLTEGRRHAGIVAAVRRRPFAVASGVASISAPLLVG